MPIEIVRNDITRMQVDAIVNAASRLPRVNALCQILPQPGRLYQGKGRRIYGNPS